MEATAEIPDLKFAKVGDKRERKKGGAPLWFNAARGANSFSGAAGGAGLSGGGLLTQLIPKLAMLMMVGSIGAGAYGFKMAMTPQKIFSPAQPRKLFASPSAAQKYSGDLSSLPGGKDSSQSGLNMVQGGLYGDASAPPAGAAGQSAVQNAAGQADKAAETAPATPDAAAMAAAAAGAAGGAGNAGKTSPFSSRFGSLSTSFGSGSGLSGGGGMFGGVGHPFANGNLGAFSAQAQAGRAQTQASPTAKNPATRLAARQLNNAFLGSGAAARNTTGVGEGASYNASQPFDNGGQQAGQIQGPTGSAQSGAGTQAGAPNTPPASGSGPTDSNGPTEAGSPTNPMTNCVQLLGSNYSNSANGGCVQTTAGTSVDSADTMFDILKILFVAATIVATLMALAQLSWFNMVDGVYALLGKILMGLGIAIAMVGVAMAAATSHHLEGTLFAAMGAWIAIAAYWDPNGSMVMASAAVISMVGMLSSFLTPSSSTASSLQ